MSMQSHIETAPFELDLELRRQRWPAWLGIRLSSQSRPDWRRNDAANRHFSHPLAEMERGL